MSDNIRKIHSIKDFNCSTDTVIEASAGTGKTYTITELVVPWLLENTDYSLSNILIVTYTKKATGELRDRIRKKLNEISDALNGQNDERSLCYKAKIDQELEKIDDAPIFTINSFCQKTLTENAIYANCTQNMTLIDEGAELNTFIGKYLRDTLIKNEAPVFMYLYNTPQPFLSAMTSAIKKYYLNGAHENPDIISLDKLTPAEEQGYKKATEIIKMLPTISDVAELGRQKKEIKPEALRRWFVIKHITEIYQAWQLEKTNKNQQTYGDMIKIVHDAITEKSSKLLDVLKDKYKYAIIDEFQDTNKIQWNIFKKIFTTDADHHITIVGDNKQSIYSFQGADPAVYEVAKTEIRNNTKRNVAVWELNENYRSSEPMINAINVLAKDKIVVGDIADSYQDSTFPERKNPIMPAKLNGNVTQPVHIILHEKQSPDEQKYITVEDTIVSKIIEYCTPDNFGQTPLQIWHKDKNAYCNATFGDFTVLVRNRDDAAGLIEKMTHAQIPFMWYKDASLFMSKESADWVALLSAITAPDFNASNRNILRRALQTAFFDISICDINNDKYNNILCPERQMLLKWHNLAETKHYAKLINSIIEESKISERLASYDKIQSLTKYIQVGNFILDYIVSKHASIATVTQVLNQRKHKKTNDEDGQLVEKSTDNDTVKISTIHAAKGLEFPVTVYLMCAESAHKTYVHVKHKCDDSGKDTVHLHISEKQEPERSDIDALRYVAITRASSMMMMIWSGCPNIDQYSAMPDLFALVKSDATYNCAAAILQKNDVVGTDSAPDVPGTIPMSSKRLYKHSYTSLSHHKNDTGEDMNILITEKTQRIDKEDDSGATGDFSTYRYDCDCGVAIRDGIYDANNIIDVSSDLYGKQYGTIIHEIFERIDFNVFEKSDNASRKNYLKPIIEKCCKKHMFDCKNSEIISYIINTMSAKIPEIIGNHPTGNKFCLSSLTNQDRKPEIEFDFGFYPDNKDVLKNYCNGFIDLLFVREIDGRRVYSILDWKSDLFKSDKDYANYESLKSHTDERYAIQRVLYSYCLIKWLAQFYPEQSESDIFNNHFGGIYYVYVRGCNSGTGNGIYAHTWADYDRLENAFKEVIKGIYNG